MEEYFEVIPINKEIYHIYEPGDVGSTLIVGEKQALLIDTGYGFSDVHTVVKKLTDKPLQVVNTHGHTDHAGGNRYFEKVWMHPADVPTYEDYQVNQKPLVAARFEGIRKAAGKKNVWPEDFDRMAWYEAGTKEFMWLLNGQTFELDENHRVEVIWIPGHTIGSVMLFDWKYHILFPGDNLDYSLWMHFNTSVSLKTYINRLEILKKYPIEAILPAHKRRLLTPWIFEQMPEVIRHLSVEKSRRFFHPRTGQPGYLYKEHLNGRSPDGIDTIYITFQSEKIN